VIQLKPQVKAIMPKSSFGRKVPTGTTILSRQFHNNLRARYDLPEFLEQKGALHASCNVLINH